MKTIITLCILFVCCTSDAQNFQLNHFNDKTDSKPFVITSFQIEKQSNIFKTYDRLLNKTQIDNSEHNGMPIKQKLDSIISIPIDSTLNSQKSEFTYNSDGNLVTDSEYDLDNISKIWLPVYKTEWTFNPQRKILNTITYFGDNQTWIKEYKFENVYDGSGKIIQVIGSAWNDTTGLWEVGFKLDHTYDGTGHLIVSLTSIWNPTLSIWEPSDKIEYEYNTDGRVVISIYYEWQAKWVYSRKEEFTYYVFGKVNNYFYYIWDGSGDWANYSKTEFQYNANYQLNKVTELRWDVISVIYVNFRKAEYKYDVDNNMYQCVYSKWVKQLQNFIFEAKEDCTYNNQFVYDELLLPPALKFSQTSNRITDNEVYFNHMLNKVGYFLHNGTVYVLNNNQYFYYSPIIITKTNTELNSYEISVNPNPANERVNFICDENTSYHIQLYNFSGLVILQTAFKGHIEINTNSLARGMYLYKIESDTKAINTGKLIIN
jgi:hypothetical protein